MMTRCPITSLSIIGLDGLALPSFSSLISAFLFYSLSIYALAVRRAIDNSWIKPEEFTIMINLKLMKRRMKMFL
jgi:hypothetical protein